MGIPFDSAFSAFGGSTALHGFDNFMSPSLQSVNIKSEEENEFPFRETTTKFNELMAEPFTVSPQELLSTGSSIFSVIESPSMPLSEGNGVCSTSPLFDEQELGPTDEWVSLFGSNETSKSSDCQSCVSDTPGLVLPVLPPSSTSPRVPSTPQLETKSSSPGCKSSNKRQKNTSGSSYTKRPRTTPLPEISPDSDDPVALKRARNTEAARRSRARKMERMEELEGMVSELTRRNKELESQVRLLQEQVSNN